MSKNENSGIWREYARGIWEIVPGHKYSNLTDFQNFVINNNPPSFYDYDESHHYQYVMATSQEHLTLDNLVGSSQAQPNGIISIVDASGTAIPLNQYLIDKSSEDSQANTELFDVWQIDSDFNFTGVKYASTSTLSPMKIC